MYRHVDFIYYRLVVQPWYRVTCPILIWFCRYYIEPSLSSINNDTSLMLLHSVTSFHSCQWNNWKSQDANDPSKSLILSLSLLAWWFWRGMLIQNWAYQRLSWSEGRKLDQLSQNSSEEFTPELLQNETTQCRSLFHHLHFYSRIEWLKTFQEVFCIDFTISLLHLARDPWKCRKCRMYMLIYAEVLSIGILLQNMWSMNCNGYRFIVYSPFRTWDDSELSYDCHNRQKCTEME